MMPVLIPEDPSSVHYHALDCGCVDADREDAEGVLGKRPHVCVTKEWNGPDRPRHDPPEVPA